MSKRNITALSILVAIVAGLLAQEATKRFLNRSPDVRSTKFLSKVASELNQSLPMMVDAETELMNAAGGENLFVYNYRLVNYVASEVDWAQLRTDIEPLVVNAACSTPEIRDDFINEGITVRYTYSGAERTQIGSIEVTQAICQSASGGSA